MIEIIVGGETYRVYIDEIITDVNGVQTYIKGGGNYLYTAKYGFSPKEYDTFYSANCEIRAIIHHNNNWYDCDGSNHCYVFSLFKLIRH